MEFKITEEQIFEVAERYGLIAKKSDNPGFYIGNRKVTAEELFEKLFLNDNNNLEKSVEVEIKIDKFIVEKNQNKLTFKLIKNLYDWEILGVA